LRFCDLQNPQIHDTQAMWQQQDGAISPHRDRRSGGTTPRERNGLAADRNGSRRQGAAMAAATRPKGALETLSPALPRRLAHGAYSQK
jgi:hypothetical protein